MSKALEITKDIVVSALGSLHVNGFIMGEETGKETADFFAAVYAKVEELEEASDKKLSDRMGY